MWRDKISIKIEFDKKEIGYFKRTGENKNKELSDLCDKIKNYFYEKDKKLSLEKELKKKLDVIEGVKSTRKKYLA